MLLAIEIAVVVRTVVMSTVITRFILCNMFLSEWLVILTLKVVVQNDRDFIEVSEYL